MKNFKTLYVAAGLTLMAGTLLASGLIMREAKLWAIPFWALAIFLGYCSWSVWKWKKPTEQEEASARITRDSVKIKHELDRQKVYSLISKLSQIADIYKHQANETLAANNIQALQHLLEMYIRLALSKGDINSTNTSGCYQKDDIAQQIKELKSSMEQGRFSTQVQESKEATLELLQRRHKTLVKRDQLNSEIYADMERIEQQFDLALETAALKPVAISGSIKVASDLMLMDISQESDGSWEKDFA